jgi:hypothetical protein
MDAHPEDINKLDFRRPNGDPSMMTLGDYRQLADAAFHAGTARGTRNRYVDEDNRLAFSVLKKKKMNGRLTYEVAVQSLDAAPLPAEPEVTAKGKARLRRGRVTPLRFEVTNTGVADGLYKLSVKKKGFVRTRLRNDLLFVPAGQTKRVTVWAKPTGVGHSSVTLKAKEL